MRCNKSKNIDNLHEAALNTIALMFVSKVNNLSVYHQIVSEINVIIATKNAEVTLEFLRNNRACNFQMSKPNFYYIIKRVKDLKVLIERCKGKNDVSKEICKLVDLSLKDFYKNLNSIIKRRGDDNDV